MSLYGSMFSSITGLTAQSRALGTDSENIANINTTGFKAAPFSFDDQFLWSLNSSSVPTPLQTYNGTSFAQQLNGNNWDSGTGFFQTAVLTNRAQDIANQRSNLLERIDEYKLSIEASTKENEPLQSSDWYRPFPIEPAAKPVPEGATSQIEIKAIFPAQMRVGDQFRASSEVNDALGGVHVARLDFTKADHLALEGVLQRGQNATDQNQVSGQADFTISVQTPAAIFSREHAVTANTSLDLNFSFAGTGLDGETIWSLTPSSQNGVATPATAGTVLVEFDADGVLMNQDLIEIEIQWDEALNAQNSVFALDLSGLSLADVGAPAVADPATQITSSLNPAGAILKLEVESRYEGDEVVDWRGVFVEFNTSGDLVSPEKIEMEFDWSNLLTFAPNTQVTLDLGETNTQQGLSIGGVDFVLVSVTSDGRTEGDIKYVLSGPAGRNTVVYENGEERLVDDIAIAEVRDLDIPVYKASPEQPRLSPPRPNREESGPEEHRQFSEFGYMLPTDLVAGPARIIGSDAAETLTVQARGGAVHGFDGDDQIHGSAGNDNLYGGNGDDTFYGIDGKDILVGWFGEDTLDLHQSGSALVGGTHIIINGDGDKVTLSGIETIIGSTFSDRLGTGGSNKTIYGRGGNDQLTGGNEDDVLIGNSGHDSIRGGHGDDKLYGGTGHDFLNGRQGQDFVSGGAGDDRVYGHNGDDVLLGGDGQDRIWGFNNDDKLGGGSGDDRLIGGGGEDDIAGGAGMDRINGGTGNDLLVGGSGVDILRGGDGADTFRMEEGFGIDKILDFTSGFDELHFSSAGFESFEGLRFDDFANFVRISSLDHAGAGNTVILVGLASSDVSADDFVFA